MSPGTGKIEFSYKRPDLLEHSWPVKNSCDNFTGKKLDLCWNLLRSANEETYSLEERPGYLRLYLKAEKITELARPAFVGRRQEHKNFAASTFMEFMPENEKETSGIVLLQSNEYHYRFIRTMKKREQVLQLIKCTAGKEELLASSKYSLEEDLSKGRG